MTILTMKFSKTKAIAIILIIAAIIAAIIIAVPEKEDSQPTLAAVKVKSEGDCADFIQRLGYECAGYASDCRKVTIPKTFDDVYEKYNELQAENGFDLSDYQGKEVTLYTFYVQNYSGYNDVLADVLVYKNKVIGGAVYTADVNGFMHGLCENPTMGYAN